MKAVPGSSRSLTFLLGEGQRLHLHLSEIQDLKLLWFLFHFPLCTLTYTSCQFSTHQVTHLVLGLQSKQKTCYIFISIISAPQKCPMDSSYHIQHYALWVERRSVQKLITRCKVSDEVVIEGFLFWMISIPIFNTSLSASIHFPNAGIWRSVSVCSQAAMGWHTAPLEVMKVESNRFRLTCYTPLCLAPFRNLSRMV